MTMSHRTAASTSRWRTIIVLDRIAKVEKRTLQSLTFNQNNERIPSTTTTTTSWDNHTDFTLFPISSFSTRKISCLPYHQHFQWLGVRTLSTTSSSADKTQSLTDSLLSGVGGDPAIDLLTQETRTILEGNQQSNNSNSKATTTKSFMDTNNNMTLQLMKEWLYVAPNDTTITKEKVATIMEALFRHWLQQFQHHPSSTLPKTSLPFRLTLESWRRVDNGTKCAQVLDEWGEMLGGDLTLAPNIDAFHVVMDAYSKQSIISSQENNDDSSPLTMVEDLLLLLQQWHTAGNVWAQPTVETYSYVISTIVKHILNREKVLGNQQQQIDLYKQRSLDLLKEMQHAYTNKSSSSSSGGQPRDIYFLTKSYGEVLQMLDGETEKTADENDVQLLQQLYETIRKEDLRIVNDATNPLPRLLLLNGDDNNTTDHLMTETHNDNHYYLYKDDSLQYILGQAYDVVLQRLWKILSMRNRKGDHFINTTLAREIHQLVEQLEELGAIWSQLPFPQHYYTAIKAWTKTVKPAYLLPKSLTSSNDDVQIDAEIHCEDLLHRLEARHLVDATTTANFNEDPDYNIDNGMHISGIPYERLLWVWSQTGKGSRAHDLLMHFMSLQDQGFLALHGDMNQYWNHTLNAYLREGQLDRVLKLWSDMQTAKIQPNAFTYNIVLRALAQSPKPSAAPQAHAILEKMINSHDVQPTASDYGSAMTAWSRSRDKKAARKAHEVLERLEEVYSRSHNNPELKPSPAHYTAVITAWGRSHDRDAASNAEKVFKIMCNHGETDDSFKPDLVSYSAMINALSRARNPNAARKAQILLEEAEYLSRQSGQGSMRLNKVIYTSVISAWTRSGVSDGPERAHEVFDKLLQAYEASGGDHSLLPDEYTYGSMIGAWANSRKKEAGERAEALLNMMEEQRSKLHEGPVPNAIVFTNVIIAHWKGGKADGAFMAQKVLERMIQSYQDGNLNAKPDTMAYTCVIQAWARNTAPDKAQKAWKLLQQMMDAYGKGDLDVRPSFVTYSAVLNACAYTRGNKRDQDNAIKIALMVMAELQSKNEKASHITFRTLLLVFAKQVPDEKERSRLSSVAFERCCREGQVDESVIGTLRMNMPSLYEKLPRNSQGALDIPAAWSKNVDLHNA